LHGKDNNDYKLKHNFEYMDYAELYEFLRKEKYSEQLQVLPKNFIEDVSSFLHERRSQIAGGDDFSEDYFKIKKQFENALSIFRELMRIRKKKLLNLAFAASETGIMKRDFGSLLGFEQELFEKIVSAVGEGEKILQSKLNNTKEKSSEDKMIMVSQPIGEFIDLSGGVVGPFDKGMLINLNSKVADILVSEGKANFVDV